MSESTGELEARDIALLRSVQAMERGEPIEVTTARAWAFYDYLTGGTLPAVSQLEDKPVRLK